MVIYTNCIHYSVTYEAVKQEITGPQNHFEILSSIYITEIEPLVHQQNKLRAIKWQTDIYNMQYGWYC